MVSMCDWVNVYKQTDPLRWWRGWKFDIRKMHAEVKFYLMSPKVL